MRPARLEDLEIQADAEASSGDLLHDIERSIIFKRLVAGSVNYPAPVNLRPAPATNITLDDLLRTFGSVSTIEGLAGYLAQGDDRADDRVAYQWEFESDGISVSEYVIDKARDEFAPVSLGGRAITSLLFAREMFSRALARA